MEEDIFDFSIYYKRRQICFKPIDQGKQLEHSELGYFNHCTAPSDCSDDKLKEEFYSGNGRFYFYDIKLCHTTNQFQYKDFIKEFLRRGKEYPCVLHLSNSTVPDRFNAMTSIYDIPYFRSLLAKLLTIESDVAVEISDKRVWETPQHEMYRLEEIYNILDNKDNVRHYMIREEIYDRHLKLDPEKRSGVDVWFRDNHAILRKEVIRYDEKRNNQRD